MSEKWYSFDDLAVFDHEEKRFWHRQEIKELAQAMWKDVGMPSKRTNKDLGWMFRSEFFQFYNEDWENMYWDDENRWEMVELPTYLGFGIWDDENKRFNELVKLWRKNQ
jgi:hypothetical protein